MARGGDERTPPSAIAEDVWQVAFERAADGFATSTTKAMLAAFQMPVPAGLTQPQHCLAIIAGAAAAAAQQAASLAGHVGAATDPVDMLSGLHGILDTHFARKIAAEAEGEG